MSDNLSPKSLHGVVVGNHLRKGSVVISTEELRNQSVVPTAIPGETQRTEPLKNNGKGRENIMRVLTKQVEVNKEQKEFTHTVIKQITKESVIKKDRQDFIMDVYFRHESPLMKKEGVISNKHAKKKSHLSLHPPERGNLSFFLDKSNFKEPACLSTASKETKHSSKYDDVDTRVQQHGSRPSTAPGSLNPPSTFMTAAFAFAPLHTAGLAGSLSTPPRGQTKARLPPNRKTPKAAPPRPETTLLPYPQDMKTNTAGQLTFSDVWKKVEPKDIFPQASGY